MKQKLQKTINQVIGKSGNLSVPSWWMRKILNDIVEYCGEDKGISNSPAINPNSKIIFDATKLGDPIETSGQSMKFSKEQFESAIEMSASEFIEKVKSGATVEIQIKPMIITNPRFMADLTDDNDSDFLFVIYYELENLNLLELVINNDFSLQVGTINMIEEFGLVTQTELDNKVPDWNALEGENGYIKNKPISVTETLIKDYTLAGRSEYKLSTNGGTISFNHLFGGEIVNESGEIESFVGNRFISPNGVYDFTFSNNNGDLHLITPYAPTLILNEIQLKEKYYTPLQEGFIPKTIARTQDVENAIEDLRSNIGGKTLVEITYAELVALRNSGALTAGTYYRITDYETTTTQPNTRSAGHPFDVVVLALSESTLAEEAYAVHSNRDTAGYFQRCNLSAWKLWYCLDNKSDQFRWADGENGKGVIYRMIDEYNNDCPYDFKNIQFARYELNVPEYSSSFNSFEKAVCDMVTAQINAKDSAFLYAGLSEDGKIWENYEETIVSTVTGNIIWCYTFNDIAGNLTEGYDMSRIRSTTCDNYIAPYRYERYFEDLPNNVFLIEGAIANHLGYDSYNNTFGSSRFSKMEWCHDIVMSPQNRLNHLTHVSYSAFKRGLTCSEIKDSNSLFLGTFCQHNKLNNSYAIVIQDNSEHNTFEGCDEVVIEETITHKTVSVNSNSEVKIFNPADLIS